MEGTSDPAFPVEILQRIISFVDDQPTLRLCSQTSRLLVQPAQRELFQAIDLISHHQRLISFQIVLRLSPRLASYISSIHIVPDQDKAKELLSLLPNVRCLVFASRTGNRRRILSFELEELFWGNLFQNITALVLKNLNPPIEVVTSCPRLVSLVLENCDMQFPEDEYDPREIIWPFLKLLVIDGTRNSIGPYSPITTLVGRGHCPFLECLRLLTLDHAPRPYFPETDLVGITNPFTSSLRCLDLDYWELPAGSILLTHDNPIFFGRFSNLVILRVTFMFSEHIWYDWGWLEFDADILRHLDWLIQMIENLSYPHPLSTLVLDNAVHEGENLYNVPRRAAWKRLDEALHSSPPTNDRKTTVSVSKLPALSLVAIPLTLGLTLTAAPIFQADLPICQRTGKLSFERVNIEDAFWSISDS
ncbi:hypothetical protein DL96DRAFT_1715497 [Flagelloscypha sp. PMI_526]|nr:hypothetical protein DL96DRAFT_1715497 [Flagelloscypha sp. PMI_526]